LNYRVIDVQAGSSPDDKEKYANKRAEIWGRMREWLKGDVKIPDDDGLKSALIGSEYGFNTKNAIQLEKKEDMKKRGLSSPDEGDALAMSFAEPVRSHRESLAPPGMGLQRQAGRILRRPPGLSRNIDWRTV
jgi:hypothetical protein